MANLDLYKVDLDTPQPNGRKGESPRAAFTKYNDLIGALGSEIEQAGFYVSNTAPDNPIAYMQWVDTSVSPVMLKRWDKDEEDWVEIGPVLRALGSASELDAGTENSEIRTNGENDSRFVKGQAGIDELEFRNNSENDERFVKGGKVVQETGDATDDLMSQKAATDAFAQLSGGDDADFSSMPKVSGDHIVETGNIASGMWAKYAGGMLIQQAVITLEYFSDTYLTHMWHFPVVFYDATYSVSVVIDAPTKALSNSVRNNEWGESFIEGGKGSDKKRITIPRKDNGSFVQGDTLEAHVIAIGRWK